MLALQLSHLKAKKPTISLEENLLKQLKKHLQEEFTAEKQYGKIVDAACDKEYIEMAQWFEELTEEAVEVA